MNSLCNSLPLINLFILVIFCFVFIAHSLFIEPLADFIFFSILNTYKFTNICKIYYHFLANSSPVSSTNSYNTIFDTSIFIHISIISTLYTSSITSLDASPSLASFINLLSSFYTSVISSPSKLPHNICADRNMFPIVYENTKLMQSMSFLFYLKLACLNYFIPTCLKF